MNDLTDHITVPDEDEPVAFAEDAQGPDEALLAIIRIRDEAGEEALTDEEYAILQSYEGVSVGMDASASDHHANLANHIDANELSRIASDVLSWVEWDEESRSAWQEKEKKGIRAMGVSPNVESKTDAAFEGGSTVVHPLMGEACVQFASRALDSMWPAAGPVRTAVLGAITTERQEQAKRVEQFLNYQYTQLMPGAFEHTDKMLIRLPLSGSCFIKAYFDPICGVMRSLVEPADFIVPFRATDLETTPRYTERVMMTRNNVRRRQVARLYRDITLGQPTEDATADVVDEEVKLTEGRTDSGAAQDNDRHTLYECYCELNLQGFEDANDGKSTGIALPYVVTVDKDSQQVLSIYRNWREGDPAKKRIIYHVHYRFMPGLGFYGYGLYHWIGGLSDAATGALRALLDSAAFANLQGGYRQGDVAIEGGDSPIKPGEFREVVTDMDDIRKALIPFNFKEPSQVLFALMGHMEQLGQRFAGTAESLVGDGNQNTPVGTILARIEQGSKPFTAVQKRLHQAAGQEYKLIAWLDSMYLPDEYPYAVAGEDRSVKRADFDDRIDVIPVSDPNVIGQMQRYFVSQAVMELSASAPDLYDRHELHRRALESLRVDNIEALLPKKEGMRRGPVEEGAAAMMSLPLKAFIDQMHDAHMTVHQAQMQAAQPNSPPALAMMAHIQEHAAMAYLLQMQQMTGIQYAMPGDEGEGEQALPAEAEAQIAMAAAQAAAQMAAPPQEPPPDPGAVKAQAEIARKDELAQAEIERKDALAAADIKRRAAETAAGIHRDAARSGL